MRRRHALGALVLTTSLACVPADENLSLGSAQFTITGRGSPRLFDENLVSDGWSIAVERFVISFRTMTIVNLVISDQCAYRGRGAVSNVLFDGTVGSVIQAFNGIKPGACPDVGVRLGVPDDQTVLGEGATTEDLVAFAKNGELALLEATATHKAEGASDQVVHLSLRFDAARTAIAFGGCRDAIKGAVIRAEARYAVLVSFATEAFFRNAFTAAAPLYFSPFLDADRIGNDDHTVTIDELDRLPLSQVANDYGLGYQLPSVGTSAASFGDYVRAQFQFSLKYGNGGLCNGLAPGTELDP